MIRIAAATIAAGAASPALGAQLYVSGEQANELCGSTPDWCLGFVTGALDGWAAMESYYPGEKFCTPEAATARQLKDIFVDELAAHPERRDSPGAYIFYERMIAEFPCR